MDWNHVRGEWQNQPAMTLIETRSTAERAQERDRRLHRRVRVRDAIETTVALLLAPVFAGATWFLGRNELWLSAIASLWLTAWCLYVPYHLRRARLLIPKLHADQDMLQFLEQERAAAIAQFQLLDRILVWYLGPAGIGVMLFYVGVKGPGLDSLWYSLSVIGLYGLIYLGNRAGARKQVLPRIQQIERDIEELKKDL